MVLSVWQWWFITREIILVLIKEKCIQFNTVVCLRIRPALSQSPPNPLTPFSSNQPYDSNRLVDSKQKKWIKILSRNRVVHLL